MKLTLRLTNEFKGTLQSILNEHYSHWAVNISPSNTVYKTVYGRTLFKIKGDFVTFYANRHDFNSHIHLCELKSYIQVNKGLIVSHESSCPEDFPMLETTTRPFFDPHQWVKRMEAWLKVTNCTDQDFVARIRANVDAFYKDDSAYKLAQVKKDMANG